MAVIDTARGLLVIRVVYDGPALSGKTTSLKALADGVGRPLECPEERDGRTVYFDWMEYVGGLFDGRQIRCQIISVPGQRELAHRRALLLEDADAVVCVLDTRRPELEFGLSWLHDLAPHCRSKSPPAGIVLQANKRDAGDAVPREELRQRVHQIAPIAIVESVATVSDGIREAFVLAVRLALDRVRALSTEGRLEHGTPAEQSASDLLSALQNAEANRQLKLLPSKNERLSDPLHLALDTPASEPVTSDADDPEELFVPDPMMPGGMIWPPVDGRALLHEVSSLGIRPSRTKRGDWWGSAAGWRFHSRPQDLFLDADAARTHLIEWARLHATHAALLSRGRAVILADAGGGRLRLWQLVRVEPTLRERLDSSLNASDPSEVASGVFDVANELLAARDAFSHSAVDLPCTLWTVGAERTNMPRFVGLMPPLDARHADVEPLRLWERELAHHLRELRRTRVDFPQVARELVSHAERSKHSVVAGGLSTVIRSLA